MRDIKFRGIKTGNQGFRYGHYHKLGEQHFIRTGSMLSNVYEDTIGQYTGLKDNNGVEIYEGDILSDKNYTNIKGEVYYENGIFKCIDFDSLYEDLSEFELEVIGNIYQKGE